MHRRESLKLVGSGIAGLGTGFLFLSGSNKATASVEMNRFSISDASTTTRDGTISDVIVAVSGEWSYDVPNNKGPSSWTLELIVDPQDTQTVVAEQQGTAMYLTGSGSFELQGSLLSTDRYSSSDFTQDSEGETLTKDLRFKLAFQVAESDGTVIAGSEQTDLSSVSVTNEQYNTSEHGSLTGSGNLTLEG